MDDNSGNEKAMILALCNKPIAFQPILAKISGGALSGLFLSQSLYWTGRGSDKDGWFHKTISEWEEETCMTRSEQETVRKQLRAKGFIEEDKRGLPAKLFYRVAFDEIAFAISNTTISTQTCTTKSRRLAEANPADLFAGMTQTNYTENTTEITPENNNLNSADAAAKNPIAVVCDGFKLKHGRNPAIIGQDAKQIKTFAEKMGLDVFTAAVERYFASTGNWEQGNNWDVKTFLRSPDKYAPSPAADDPLADYDWTKGG